MHTYISILTPEAVQNYAETLKPIPIVGTIDAKGEMVAEKEADTSLFPPSQILAPTKLRNILEAQKVPPIIISDQKFWMRARVPLQQEKIQIKHCTTKFDGIHVHTSKIQDHPITRVLDEGKYKYHTFK